MVTIRAPRGTPALASRGRAAPRAFALATALVAAGVAVDARAGTPLEVTWTDCVVAPNVDADRDGLDDACELAVVKGFEPELVFGPLETAPARIPFWSARPETSETLRIFYALSYLVDAGDPTLGGVSAHDGDSEFIVLRVRYEGAGSWTLVEGYLSAHYATVCDAGGWFSADEFTYADFEGGRPIVHVAEGKHANYVDAASCDAGGCYQDHCGDMLRGKVGILPGRDLGVRSTPIRASYDYASTTEWYWDDVPFCGWQRPPGDARAGCAPAANSYAAQLDDFGMDAAPVAPIAGFCEVCTFDADCRDGGLCVGGTCGRACEATDCPAGAGCVDVRFGVLQCRAEVACACALACEGRACGDDGCGGSCGVCGDGEECDGSGQCVVLGSGSSGPPQGEVLPGEDGASQSTLARGCAVSVASNAPPANALGTLVAATMLSMAAVRRTRRRR
ncbi:MAG: hypothetical protein FJ096_05530 [Deltaproteobacteria bacterium]|nr:hypothetical protein [Deltaproteobacteria bacterium]